MGIVIDAPAKVNLALDVVGRRSDGYHLLKMVAQSVDLHDTLVIEDLGPTVGSVEVEIDCDWPEIPTDSRNSVYKAVAVLAEAVNLRRKVVISLTKRIPVSSGLGGESTDAAAALRGLRELYDLRFSAQELRDLGSRVGADVPFCIEGGTALVEGIGDLVSPLEWDSRGWGLLMVRPPDAISTAEVYRRFSRFPISGCYPRPDVDGLVSWMARSARTDGRPTLPEDAYFRNALEAVTAEDIPQVGALKERLLALGAVASVMTGHGPTVVGLFDESRLDELGDLEEIFPGLWSAKVIAWPTP